MTQKQLVLRQLPIMNAVLALLILAFFAVFYRHEAAGLFQSWQRDEYSFAFLLVPLAFVWGWTGIEKAKVPLTVYPAGLLIVAASVLINIVGTLVANIWLANVGVLVSLFGIALTVLGPRAMRAAWKAWVLLVFVIPLPPSILAQMTAKMQLVSSMWGSALLDLLGLSVYREGNVIDLGVIKLQVAEACSGLRYFFPLLCLGFLIAFLLDTARWIRAVIIISILPISILMNAMRIATIGIAANVWGQEVALGLVHDLEGWVAYGICLVLLTLEVWGLSWMAKRPIVIEEMFPSWTRKAFASAKFPSLAILGVLVLVFGAGAGGKIYWQSRGSSVQPLNVMLDSFPLTLGEWKGKARSLSKEDLDVLRLTSYFQADFVRAEGGEAVGVPVNFYIAYYADQTLNAAPHSPKVCLPGSGWEMELDDNFVFPLTTGQTLTVNRAVLRKGDATSLVYFWLRERGHDVASTLEVKWRLLIDGLRSGRRDGALIRVVVPVPSGTPIDAQDKVLQKFIGDIWEDLNAVLPVDQKAP